MLSSNLLQSKIPMSGGGRGLVGGTNFQLLMLSSNLLKSKIPLSRGWRGWWNQLSTFNAESKFALKKNFVKNFLSFRTKIGTVLFWTLSTEWFPYTKYRRTTNIKTLSTTTKQLHLI